MTPEEALLRFMTSLTAVDTAPTPSSIRSHSAGKGSRGSSSTPESALITRRSGISSCFQVDVFVFYVSGSSSSS
ncbi:unnamed protein product [Pleuronectes platessa]|uniref:Uncharacterized protein n=1 Tax=Pleuronectes platessa TaxID=8262 RepID=A0A9N7UET6_PLEPL|nr:unnamed protein product [Pleuronectes platessa]